MGSHIEMHTPSWSANPKEPVTTFEFPSIPFRAGACLETNMVDTLSYMMAQMIFSSMHDSISLEHYFYQGNT